MGGVFNSQGENGSQDNPIRNAIAKSCKAKNLGSRTMLAIVALWVLAQSGEAQKAIKYTDYFLGNFRAAFDRTIR